MTVKRAKLKNMSGDYIYPFVDQVANMKSGGDPIKIWRGTQQEYDSILTKDSNTLYITGDMNTTVGGVTYVEIVEEAEAEEE